MRLLVNFLDEAIPYLADPAIPVHDDPLHPITRAARSSSRACARRHPHRLVVARRSLRRAAFARHQVRRHHRRDRPRQTRLRREHERRRRPALRPHPPHASRHLRDERTARARRAGPSRAVQHSRRARRADSRLSDQVRPRRADPLQRQPRHLQPQRQGHPPAQRPHRLADPYSLSARTRTRRGRSWSKKPTPRRKAEGRRRTKPILLLPPSALRLPPSLFPTS